MEITKLDGDRLLKRILEIKKLMTINGDLLFWTQLEGLKELMWEMELKDKIRVWEIKPLKINKKSGKIKEILILVFQIKIRPHQSVRHLQLHQLRPRKLSKLKPTQLFLSSKRSDQLNQPPPYLPQQTHPKQSQLQPFHPKINQPNQPSTVDSES